jgi:hypothetical protein
MVIPHMADLSRKYGKDGLIVIGMNLEDAGAQGPAVRSFVKRNRMDYQNVFASHAIYQFFSGLAAARIPYTLLFGADGTLAWRLLGYSPQIGASLNGAVQKALAAAPEKPAEQSASENQTEQSAPERQTEQVTPEKLVEPVVPEKPIEPVAPEKPAEKGTPEKGTIENPTELEAPKTKTCDCNCSCCSSHAQEKRTEQDAPAKTAEP